MVPEVRSPAHLLGRMDPAHRHHVPRGRALGGCLSLPRLPGRQYVAPGHVRGRHFDGRGILHEAALLGQRAARVEAATRWDGVGRRDLAPERRAGRRLRPVRGWASSSAAVYGCCRPTRRPRDAGPVSTIWPRYMTATACADVRDHRQLVGDEDHRQPEPVGEVDEQVEDLRLDRDVQGADGLVRDQQLRLEREARAIATRWRWPPRELAADAARHRDGRPTRSSSSATARPSRRLGRRCRARAAARAIASPTVIRGLSDVYGSWKTSWMLRRRRAVSAARAQDVGPVEEDRAGVRLDQPDDAAGERRLAAARLADDPERLVPARDGRGRRRSSAERGVAADAVRRSPPAQPANCLTRSRHLEQAAAAGASSALSRASGR